jgi:hypothetical protein
MESEVRKPWYACPPTWGQLIGAIIGVSGAVYWLNQASMKELQRENSDLKTQVVQLRSDQHASDIAFQKQIETLCFLLREPEPLSRK